LPGGKPLNRRKDGDTKAVYDRIIEGQTPTTISRNLKLTRPLVYYHLAKLCHDNMLTCDLGHYSPGPVPCTFKPDTPLEGVAPKPDTSPSEPGFRFHTGWQFSARINPPVRLPKSNSIGHHAASFKKRYRLAATMWATVQAQGREDNGSVIAKTALITLDQFEGSPDDLPHLEETVSKAAWAAVVKFEKDTGAHIGLAEIAKVGEIVKPDPRLAGAGHIQTSPNSQIDQSPPGPAWECKGNRKGTLEAITEYHLPAVIRQLEHTIYSYMEENGKGIEAMLKGLTQIIELEKMHTQQNESIRDMFSQLLNPPPRDTSERLEGYR